MLVEKGFSKLDFRPFEKKFVSGPRPFSRTKIIFDIDWEVDIVYFWKENCFMVIENNFWVEQFFRSWDPDPFEIKIEILFPNAL